MDPHSYGRKLSAKIANYGDEIGKFKPYYENGVLAWVRGTSYPKQVVFATPLYAVDSCGKCIVVTKSNGEGERLEFEPSGNLEEDIGNYYEIMTGWFEKNIST